METNRKTWTLEEVAARRATGDTLVTHDGWCASYETTNGAKPATLHLRRLAVDSQGRWTDTVAERDPRDGHVFPTTEDAQLYALSRGCLVWYRDWQAEQRAMSTSRTIVLGDGSTAVFTRLPSARSPESQALPAVPRDVQEDAVSLAASIIEGMGHRGSGGSKRKSLALTATSKRRRGRNIRKEHAS